MRWMININGKMLPEKKAHVSVLDHGFLYGDSVFETFRTYGGFPFLFQDHIDRLYRSASRIFLLVPFSKDALKKEVLKSIRYYWKCHYICDLYIRIIISRGYGDIGFDPALCKRPTSIIIIKPFTPIKASLYKRGVRMAIASTLRNHPKALDPNIKSGNYLNNILAYIEAKKEKAYDAVMINHQGFIAEATNSNIFIIKKRILHTPALSHGLLKGLTRTFILRVADQLKIRVKEANIRLNTFFSADECFISSSLREILPVTECVYKGKIHTFGTGKPGDVTRELMSRFKDEVKEAIQEEFCIDP